MSDKMKNLKIIIDILIYLVLVIPLFIIGSYYDYVNLFTTILFIGWVYMAQDVSNKISNWIFEELENADEDY